MKIQRPSFDFEKNFWNNGINYVIGIDEVGRGAFAGPIVAAAVVFESGINEQILIDINDSKLLKTEQRNRCAEIIKRHSLFYEIEQINISYINKFGIGKANCAVFRKVIKKLLSKINSESYSILIDGFHKKYLPGGIKKQHGIVKGDQKSLSIAAASILAKVYRDDLMKQISFKFPEYNFSNNKGYGTKNHQEALMLYGLTEIHRTSFNLRRYL